MTRADGRAADELRRVEFETGFTSAPDGSVLTRFGKTMVLCTCRVVPGIPRFRAEGSGWMTAEYCMTPGSTNDRFQRERRGAKGRTMEIERLIGRSLRACVDLAGFGDHTVHVDCEVLQADGGTRTASISGAFVALALAADSMLERGLITRSPFKGTLGAVSCGIIDGAPMLDLPYEEDARAEIDLNLVLLDGSAIVELQATGEEGVMSRAELDALLELGTAGVRSLAGIQHEALGAGTCARLRLQALA